MDKQMRALDLDYRRKPAQLTLWGIVIFILAMAVLVPAVIYYRQITLQGTILESRLQQLQSTDSRSANKVVRRDTRAVAAEVKQANQILRMLGMRWDSIFGAVASAHRDGVALLALAPEPEKGIVKITAEAKSFSIMLDYVKRLEEQPALDAVFLQSHSLQINDPQKPVRFVITANWLDK